MNLTGTCKCGVRYKAHTDDCYYQSRPSEQGNYWLKCSSCHSKIVMSEIVTYFTDKNLDKG